METKLFNINKPAGLCVILLMITISALYAQNLREIKLNIKKESITLEQLLGHIEQHTEFKFTYNPENIPLDAKVKIIEGEISLYDLLYNLAKNCGVSFHRISRQIVIKKAGANEKNLVTDQNSNVIRGIVIDAKTKEPLAFASVYLSGTTIGAMTDDMGKYIIRNIPKGTYNLVFSILGYSRVVKPIVITNDTQVNDVELCEKIQSGKEITVFGESPLEWKKRLKKFKKEFLGESSNADDCEILNPEVIDFRINKNTNELIAAAQEPIAIINNSLGYRINIYLQDFVWSISGDAGKYQIYPHFDELSSTDESEQSKWQASRKKTYLGSFRHFLKSCAEGRVYEEGFRVCKSHVSFNWMYTNKIDSLLIQTKTATDSIIYTKIHKVKPDEYCIVYDSLLQVAYVGAYEDSHYKDYMERLTGSSSIKLLRRIDKSITQIAPHQTSWIIFPSGELYFSSSGICSDEVAYGKKIAGYWAWNRISDLLPFNYDQQ